MKEQDRKERAAILADLRKVHTPNLTMRERNGAIRANASYFLKTLAYLAAV